MARHSRRTIEKITQGLDPSVGGRHASFGDISYVHFTGDSMVYPYTPIEKRRMNFTYGSRNYTFRTRRISWRTRSRCCAVYSGSKASKSPLRETAPRSSSNSNRSGPSVPRALLRAVYRNDDDTRAIQSPAFYESVAAQRTMNLTKVVSRRGDCGTAHPNRENWSREWTRTRAHIPRSITPRSVTWIPRSPSIAKEQTFALEREAPAGKSLHRQSFLVRDRVSAIHILTDQSEHFPDTLLHPQNTLTIVVVYIRGNTRALFPTNSNAQSEWDGFRDSIREIHRRKVNQEEGTISLDRCAGPVWQIGCRWRSGDDKRDEGGRGGERVRVNPTIARHERHVVMLASD